jgi:hypothetical protein
MNLASRSLERLFLCALFVTALAVLPACGKKTMRTEIKQAEDVSASAEATPTDETATETTDDAQAQSNATTGDSVYTGDDMVSAADAEDDAAKVEAKTTTNDMDSIPPPKPREFVEKVTVKTQPVVAAAPEPTATVVPVVAASEEPPAASASPLEAAPMEAAQNKGGFPWLWFLLLILVGVGAWYYWKTKKQHRPTLLQPHPPLGGLSPVSGFTGRRRK